MDFRVEPNWPLSLLSLIAAGISFIVAVIGVSMMIIESQERFEKVCVEQFAGYIENGNYEPATKTTPVLCITNRDGNLRNVTGEVDAYIVEQFNNK